MTLCIMCITMLYVRKCNQSMWPRLEQKTPRVRLNTSHGLDTTNMHKDKPDTQRTSTVALSSRACGDEPTLQEMQPNHVALAPKTQRATRNSSRDLVTTSMHKDKPDAHRTSTVLLSSRACGDEPTLQEMQPNHVDPAPKHRE
jgi:hypothetical protein